MRQLGAVRCALILGTVLCATTAVGQPAPKGGAPAGGATAAPSDSADQARKLYEKGRKLADEGKWDAAYAEFRAAYAWLDHWQIAGGLGKAAFAVGKYPEAIAMLGKHLKEANNLTAVERVEMEKQVAQAKLKCGILRVAGPAGAEVKVDTEMAGKLPLERELYALPGTHTVEITSAAGVTKITVEVTAGKETQAGGSGGGTGGVVGGVGTGGVGGGGGAGVVTAGPSPSTAPSAAPSASPSASAGDGKPSMAPVVAFGVAGGVALLAGIGVFVASEMKGGDAIQARGEYDKLVADAKKTGKVVPEQTLAEKKKAVGDLLRGQDSLVTGALGLWIGAAVLGGGAVGYFMYQNSGGKEKRGQTSAPKASLQWAPVVSPAGAGMVVRGSF